MSGLEFSCSYTKLRDVEGESPCGRPATRRARGTPKCMGHWVTDHLIDTLGRTEHARKTWWFASILLIGYGLLGGWIWWNSHSIYVYLTSALTVFSVGLLFTTAREHPLGGWLTLVSAPIIGFALVSNGILLLRQYLFADGQPPKGSSRAVESIAGATDVGTGVIFLSSFIGFLFFYWTDDRKELRFWTALNPLLTVLALLCIVALSIMTQGQYLNLRPWFVVVYPAALVARGPDQLKQLAKRLRV